MSTLRDNRVVNVFRSLSVTRWFVGLFISGVLISHVTPLLAGAAEPAEQLTGVTLSVAAIDTASDQSAQGNKTVLTARPTSCIALHRGQICYQKIRLSWTNPDDGVYCLFNDSANQELACGSGTQSHFVHEYASKTQESFSLRVQETGVSVVSLVVPTVWVYRTGKRSSSGWRLF